MGHEAPCYNISMIKIIKSPISKAELKEIAKEGFGYMVKAVVDIDQEIMAVGGELHADEEVVLMDEAGSKREHAWGVNLHVDNAGDDFIQFDSMVNIKPVFGNRSRDIGDQEIREKIRRVVEKLIQ